MSSPNGVADTELMEPQTVPTTPDVEPTAEPIAEKPKRNRGGRPRKGADVSSEPMDLFVESTDEKPAAGRSRARRSAKVTGDDVCAMVGLSSSLVAMVTQQGHWYIPEKEVKPWATEAAELLNRIPSKYAKAVTDFSGYIVVGVGIYGCCKPRYDESIRIAHERKLIERETAKRLVDDAVPAAAKVPWQ
jgi:hypothetical protein